MVTQASSREVNAAELALFADAASASAECFVPGGPTIPGGKPVSAVPGLTPRSPSIFVGPVFVTAWPPRTEKLAAAPRVGELAAGGLASTSNEITASASDSTRTIETNT